MRPRLQPILKKVVAKLYTFVGAITYLITSSNIYVQVFVINVLLYFEYT